MSKQDTREHLALYSAQCKKCHHLDPDEPKKYINCHYSKGNEYCPASEVQIVITGKAQKYAAQVLAARAKRDINAENRILQLVSAKSQAFIERFYHFLESAKSK